MFANTADPIFYTQFAQSGISRNLSEGLLKEAKDSGIELKNSAVNLAKIAQDDPGLLFNGIWNAVKEAPQSAVDSFMETGGAIGEGAAVALDPDLTNKLNALYGTDTASVQKALLAIRIAASISGAAGTAKVGATLSEATAKAVGKKLDDLLDRKAGEGGSTATKVESATASDILEVNGSVQSRINIANSRTRTTPLRASGKPVSAGFNHVMDGHFDLPVTQNRSVFSILPSELKTILQSDKVISSPVTALEVGQFVRTVNIGKEVGTTSLREGGQTTTFIKVFTDRSGNLITTYPIKGGG